MLWLSVVIDVIVKCSVLVLNVGMLFGNFLCVFFLMVVVCFGFIRFVVCFVISDLRLMLLMMLIGLSVLFLFFDIFWFFVLCMRLCM